MAIDSPLLEMSIEGAKGVLFNVQGGKNLSMFDVSEAANIIAQHVDPEAKIIFGTSVDMNLQDEIKITVIATGFSKEKEEASFRSEAINYRPNYTPPKYTPEPVYNQYNSPQPQNNYNPYQQNQPAPQQVNPQIDNDMPAFLKRKLERNNNNPQ
jgi:cell division protein FtsZ